MGVTTEAIENQTSSALESLGLEGTADFSLSMDCLDQMEQMDGAETDLYFYHPDHASALLSTCLGSCSFITDSYGMAVQHLEYLAFGEPFIEERINWGTPYRFTGKELDPETNYNYFGARYYDPAISIWLSVDPLSDKYPSSSAYAYCVNNPIQFIDPDGSDLIIWYQKNDKWNYYKFNGSTDNTPNNPFVAAVIEAWNYNIGNGGGDKLFEAATNPETKMNIVQTDGVDITDRETGTIFWNPRMGLELENDERLSPATALEHEADHSLEIITNMKEYINRTNYQEETRVRQGSELITGKANSELGPNSKGRSAISNAKMIITTGIKSNVELDPKVSLKFRNEVENMVIENIQNYNE